MSFASSPLLDENLIIKSEWKTANGDYLISSRHLHTVALIAGSQSSSPGLAIWILNGKRNQFTDSSNGAALNFSWQHDARFRNAELTEITLFDNHIANNVPGETGCEENCSKGMHLQS